MQRIHRGVGERPGQAGGVARIGERMAEHLQEILKTGDYGLRQNCLKIIPVTFAGYFAICIFGAEESGVLMVELQKRPLSRTWRKLALEASCGTCQAFGNERAEHFERWRRSSALPAFRQDVAEASANGVIAHIEKMEKASLRLRPRALCVAERKRLAISICC